MTGRISKRKKSKIEKANPGQNYQTRLEGGLLEMEAVATEEHVLVTNWDSPAQEHYLLKETKVPDKYVLGDGGLWLPKEGAPPVRLIFTNQNVAFTTSWGADFRLLAGGAMLKGVDGGFYGIQPITFHRTYKQCDQYGVVLSLPS